jgi:dihydrofolate reductase
VRRQPPGAGRARRRGLAQDVADRVASLKDEPGRDIWLCGGADLAGQLLGLVDEIQLKISPVLFGDGIPLVRGAVLPRDLDLVDLERLPGGVALATYRLGARPSGGLTRSTGPRAPGR